MRTRPRRLASLAATLLVPLALAAGCNSAGDGADGDDTNGRGISENITGAPVDTGPGGTSAGTPASGATPE